MSAARSLGEIQQTVPVPRLLVELPSWPRVFFGNLRDLIFPRRQPPLELRSAPAPFWPDVFVKRGIPWDRFLQSGACHVTAFALLIACTRFFALQPHGVTRPTFDRAQVIYYPPWEYLPPLDTRSAQATEPAKADPAFSLQPIISVPPEADNRSQTVVTPPPVKLTHEVRLPNIVAWSEKLEQPRLAIPSPPLTPAADITRSAPQLENSVVAPPPDAAHLIHGRKSAPLQSSVVAPPPDLRTSTVAAFQAPQPAVIAPPPSVETASSRPPGELNISQSSVIAPAPRLPVAEQRSIAGSRSAGIGAPRLVPPPPLLSGAGSSAEGFASRGRVIALNLDPAWGAPPNPPPGNRRGSFAAAPEGHAGASGSPGSNSGNTAARADSGGSGQAIGRGSTGKGTSDVPPGLYVGSTAAKTSPVPGSTSPNSDHPSWMASVSPPRVTSARSRPMQPESASKLSPTERAVFGNRRFYSLTLNLPNLNSAGGSWVIRFAELNHDSNHQDSKHHDSANPDANASADLSQPDATRKVDPAYPLQLMRENVAGTVILYAIIHADGRVGNVRVLRGVDDRLDQFASQAVAQWQFQPATKNGSPVDVEATFQIPFRPPRAGTIF